MIKKRRMTREKEPNRKEDFMRGEENFSYFVIGTEAAVVPASAVGQSSELDRVGEHATTYFSEKATLINREL